ncbi:putative GNAT family N-acetyltransferase [Xylariaceae sp. FL1019]|nr:putative GNAT family N-acetyltransferase [Xylariaceae sp. FL1019]
MAATNLPERYILIEGYPSVAHYLNLRLTSGLSAKTEAQATAAIKGSWYGVYVAEAATPERAIAMGRLVGDGGWYFLVTLPGHQRQGLGDVVLRKLLARVELYGGEGTALVTLSADVKGRKLYKKNGFVDSMPEAMGMWLRVEVPERGAS